MHAVETFAAARDREASAFLSLCEFKRPICMNSGPSKKEKTNIRRGKSTCNAWCWWEGGIRHARRRNNWGSPENTSAIRLRNYSVTNYYFHLSDGLTYLPFAKKKLDENLKDFERLKVIRTRYSCICFAHEGLDVRKRHVKWHENSHDRIQTIQIREEKQQKEY